MKNGKKRENKKMTTRDERAAETLASAQPEED
jgi:hypothetical protein